MTVPDEPAARPHPARRSLGRGPIPSPRPEAAARAGDEDGFDASRDEAEAPTGRTDGSGEAPTDRAGRRVEAEYATGSGAEPESDHGDADPETDSAEPAPVETAAEEAASEGVVAEEGRFTVVLENFEGPFDLLLQLIAKHKLDVTEVALSRVTDEFMAYIKAMGPDWDLDQTTEFLVVASTLLDLKAARLLPSAVVEDEADLALLEARDLLFARLLQYRAYKEIADIFAERLASEARRYPRTVGLEPRHAELLPEVVIRIGPEGFARLAVKAMQPRPEPQVYVDHIHAPLVSVREQADVMVARLRATGEASFAELTEDAPDTLTVVARFLALLELYRERAVSLDQQEALGDLTVRWSGGSGQQPVIGEEFDQEPGAPREAEQQGAGVN